MKTAIVTGSSRGIGAAVAKRLSKDGFNIVVNYSGSEDTANEVVAEIKNGGGKAIAVQANIGEPVSSAKLFDRTEEEFGGVDVLVNNAGVMKLAKISETGDEAFDQMIATNLKGVFNLLRESATRLRSGGSVVNLSSSIIGLNLETYGVYAATKAGVESFTRIFTKELLGKDITVNAIAPGPTTTKLFLDGKSDEVLEKMSKMSPLGRLGTPEDIAGVVSFLAGSDGRWINGQILRANGGIV